MKFKRAVIMMAIMISIFAMSSTAFAANMVSSMATKDGNSVAACAQNMDKGVSSCATGAGAMME